MANININSSNSIFEKNQVGTNGSVMFIANDSEWDKISQLWEEALNRVNKDSQSYGLVKEARRLTDQKDKEGLSKHVKKFFSEFTTNILAGTAVEMLLKFLL